MAMDLCPVWVGYLLANPLRRLFQNPERILAPHLRPGITVLEIGPAMGFFSLPMAAAVGPGGRVVCVDVQKPMLDRLVRRAEKAGLAERIETRTCAGDDLGVADLAGRVDFILAFAVVHEVPDQAGLFAQLAAAAKPGAELLFAEPGGHVNEAVFRRSLDLAMAAGFTETARPAVPGSRAAVLTRA
jgi:SAM-dependent methyltransferase